ncbi:MAG: efflux RND transporter permease subunit [Deltaproteobacteria bacterium]|nr:efflux RND transporter permease subunit [Deltaproteobacteria bacterium]
MNLSSLSVRRGITFGVVWLVVLLFGLFSLSRLKLDLMPDLSFPAILVVTTYTGASPEDMETLVTRPMETAVASVEGVEEISSTSSLGLSIVSVEFAWGTDMDQAETDIRRSLDMYESALPDDASDPLVFAFSTDMMPVMFLALEGSLPLMELRRLAEDVVQPRLERVEGVASANVSGGLVREIHVDLDPLRVEATGLDVNTVVSALYAENLQEPGGTIDQEPLSFTIHTQGRYASLADIGEVVVGRKVLTNGAGQPTGTRPVRLGEVASIHDTYQEATSIEQIDGVPVVQLALRRQSGENTVQAVEGVLSALPGINADLPEGARLTVVAENAGNIKRSLNNLASTALVGVCVTFAVLLFVLGDLRAALIVSMAIPLSVVATFGVMDQADMTLNVLSMAGLALAVGLLVDNAIVVLENIFRLREGGEGPWVAAASGAKGVGTAITASTLTTLAVFVPVLFVQGFAGMVFRDMAVTICFSLTVSLVVAMSFVPLASSRFLKRSGQGGEKASRRLGRLVEHYGRWLEWALSHRKYVILGFVGAGFVSGLLALTLRTDLMAQQDNGQSFVEIKAPVGSSLAETWARVDEVTRRVRTALRPEELQHLMVQAGAATGIQAIFSGEANEGTARLVLVPPGERERGRSEIEAAIREATADLAGVEVHVGGHFGPTGSSDVEVELKGHDLDQARILGMELRQRLARLPEVAEVTFSLADQQPQLEVTLDRPKLAQLGMSGHNLNRAVATAFQGRTAGFFSDGGDEFDIKVRWERAWREDVGALLRMPLATSGGATVPLSTVAHVRRDLGPVAITRVDQQRTSTLQVTLADTWQDQQGDPHRKDMRRGIQQVSEAVDLVEKPDGFTAYVGGSAEDFAESFQQLGLALLVSILLVYLVMASQFESLRQPFIIIFSVPMAIIGVILVLLVTGTALDVSGLIGAIMLVGIAVNNGIVMVDAANQLRYQGRDRVEAIREAARMRLRPVLLTTLTTVLAMVPLALEIGEGAEQWSGMARAVIGGLTTATLLTLFVVPVLYTFFARKDLETEALEFQAAGASRSPTHA